MTEEITIIEESFAVTVQDEGVTESLLVQDSEIVTVQESGAIGAGVHAGGVDGQILLKDGSGDFETRWVDHTTSVLMFMEGGASPLSVGAKGSIQIPFDAEILSVVAMADVLGDLVVDIWKAAIGDYPPTIADSITASAPVTLAGEISSNDEALTGWEKDIVAGDVLRFNVVSCETITRVTVSIKIKRKG